MNCIKMRGTGHYGDTIYKCDICVGCDMHFVRDMFLWNVNVSAMLFNRGQPLRQSLIDTSPCTGEARARL